MKASGDDMSRLNYALVNDNDMPFDFTSIGKALTTSYVSSYELAIPREMKQLALDIICRTKNSSSQISIQPQHSLLPGSAGNTYWANGCRLTNEALVTTSDAEYDAVSNTYLFKNLSDGYARRLLFDVSTSPYFRVLFKGDIAGGLIHIYACVATQESRNGQ